METVQNHTMRLFFGSSKIAESTGADILIEHNNPNAGDYEVEITPAAAGQIVVYAGTTLPAVRLGQSYTGNVYHNDGYDWLQLDVPAGVRALQLTVEAPGNVTNLDVWRGSIGSWERWSATQFGFGNRHVTLPAPASRLSQGVDLGNNLVVRVESSYDPSTRKLRVVFKGIDTRTGDYYDDGFLPPNNNEPEGEGYVSFRIRPKAGVDSGTRIVNKATITFDPHLGSNPAMETNEHVLTLDKQAP